MKNVYFVRHAKSSWEDSSLSDIERPLNPRGLRDAPFMAKMLKNKNVQADLIISSPAERALTTAKYFAKEMGVAPDKIDVNNIVYGAYPEDVIQLIKKADDSVETIMVFGHNPTFTSLVNRFTEDYIANVPTCGIVKVEADIDSWSTFGEANVVQTEFYYPKQYF
jgi:phosphohistidine phosphatase